MPEDKQFPGCWRVKDKLVCRTEPEVSIEGNALEIEFTPTDKNPRTRVPLPPKGRPVSVDIEKFGRVDILSPIPYWILQEEYEQISPEGEEITNMSLLQFEDEKTMLNYLNLMRDYHSKQTTLRVIATSTGEPGFISGKKRSIEDMELARKDYWRERVAESPVPQPWGREPYNYISSE